MINVEAGRLREPAAWLMVAVASTDVLVGTERLLFGDSFHEGASFAFRASSHVGDLTSPVVPALLVAAVLLAGHAGPAVARLRLMAQLAAGTLGLAALFGTVGVFGGLFAGETGLREKLEFLVVNLPALALTALALLYLLPTAASPGTSARSGGFGGPAERSFPERSREQYVSPQSPHSPQGGGPVPQQGFFAQEQALQQGLPGRDAAQGGLPPQAPQDFRPREQAPQQGLHQPSHQAPQQGFQQTPHQGFPQEQTLHQGFPHDQAPHQGFPHDQAPHQGFPQEQAPRQGFPHDQAPQGDALYSQQQVQPAPQPSYGPPALPPAPGADGGSDGYGPQPGGYAPVPGVPADAHPQAAYAQHGEDRSYGALAYGHVPAAPAQPAPQVPAGPAETYSPSPGVPGAPGTPGSYVPADAQPPGAAAPYEPAAAYDPPGYASSQPEPVPQVSAYGEPSPGHAPAGDHQGYAQQDQPTAFYGTRSEVSEVVVAAPYASSDGRPSPSSDGLLSPSPFDSLASFPPPPAYGQGAEVPASPYGTADSGPRLSFEGQAQQSFPQPPDNYGRPFNGYAGTEYAGAEYGRRTEPNLHYSAPAPVPDPMNPHSQQIAQAYQQAESYQQSQAGEPQPRAATGPQGGGSYDDPFGLSAVPSAQPYPQGGHQWDPAPAEATLGFDPAAYRGDALGGPAPAMTWDSQPPIDPTAIYKPERSAQVTGEETSDRERVGPGQEQNMSWYGSDRREH